jgi:hypothetical protein
MLQPNLPYDAPPDFLPLIAADEPIGAVPDLQPIIHDFERNRARNQRRQQKKRSELPAPQPETPKTPDPTHHVDDYA